MSIFLFGEVTQAWLAVSSVKHVSSTVLRGYALGFVLESQIEMAQFCAESNSGTDSCSTNQRATINETTSSRQNLWFAVSDSNLGTSTETLGPYATTRLWAARCQKSNWNVVECGLPTLDLPHPCFLRVSTKTCHGQSQEGQSSRGTKTKCFMLPRWYSLVRIHSVAHHVFALLELRDVGNAEVLRVELHHLHVQRITAGVVFSSLNMKIDICAYDGVLHFAAM